MARVLFLAHRAPFPPDKGDKIRAFHILQHLAARHDVWLGAGADDRADLEHLAAARRLCRDVCFAPLGRARRLANMAWGLAAGAPLSVARFSHPDLARWTRRILAEVRPDVVFVYSSAMAQYVLGRMPPAARLIVDFVDADAEKWRAYAKAGPGALRPIYAREFRRLLAYDRRVLAAAEAGLLVSETERRLLAGFFPGGQERLHVMPNGVDLDYFEALPPACDSRRIVLCGRMDYAPNVDAATWFVREILPAVQARHPEAVFQIVGAAPTPAVRALCERRGVEVTGAVPDVRPYLETAAVVVAPLRIARGIQNKVLEAMAAARPLVATPQALDGVDATPGRDVLVGADARSFAEAVAQVLSGQAPPELAANGRAFVVRRNRWSAQLVQLDRLIDGAGGEVSAEAAA